MFFKRVYASPLAQYLVRLEYQLNSLMVTTSNGTVSTIEKNENEMYYVYDESGRTEFKNQNEVITFCGSVTRVEVCDDEYDTVY